jgi:GntR family transcriptional regulator
LARAHKYEAVADGVAAMIVDGSLAPHSPLPSERQLMATYSVSRMTVRAAIAKLIDEGRVYNVHGSGTFVGSTEMFSKAPSLTSFTQDMVARGFSPSSRVLALVRIEADAALARWLNLPVGSECTHLRRLRIADGIPMAIEDMYVPGTILDFDDFDLDGSRSFYEQLARAGHEPYRAEQEILAASLTSEEARLLDVKDGSAALCVERIVSSSKGKAVEYTRALYRADRYSFHTVITREPA